MDKKIQRYNIAFLAEDPLPFRKVAKELFADVSVGYLLSDSSLAHITICQFETDDPKIPEEIFKEVQALNMGSYEPSMIGISFKKGTKENEGFYMAQIFIERENALIALHNSVLDMVKKHKMNCLNSNSELYKPHITLARIELKKAIPIWPESILNTSKFKLTLGLSDQSGQYIKKIYES